MPVSLYRQLLGTDFDRLPLALRAFHNSAGGGSGVGVFRVQRSTHPAARAAAWLLQLPPRGDHVPVTLQVRVKGRAELWERTFATYRLRTRQWLDAGRLIERVGIATFAFDVTADDRGMQFRSVDFTWLGVRVPRGVAMTVDADVRGFETYWEVVVIVRVPRLGVIASYDGRITPTLQ